MNKNNLYLEHILIAIEDIENATKSGEKTRTIELAVERCIGIIGEAVGKLSDDFKKKHNSVSWQEIKATRNYVIHDYFGVDYEVMWNIVDNELPKLKLEIKKILQQN